MHIPTSLSWEGRQSFNFILKKKKQQLNECQCNLRPIFYLRIYSKFCLMGLFPLDLPELRPTPAETASHHRAPLKSWSLTLLMVPRLGCCGLFKASICCVFVLLGCGRQIAIYKAKLSVLVEALTWMCCCPEWSLAGSCCTDLQSWALDHIILRFPVLSDDSLLLSPGLLEAC